MREKKEKPEKRREDEKREKRDREGKGERGRGEEGFLEFVAVFRICCGFDHLLGRRFFHGLIELKFCQHVLNSWIWFCKEKKGVWMSQLQATLS